MKWDVIVVGAGPAGSVLGYELARNGVKVLILEKEVLPRYKPCGGGITHRTMISIGLDIRPVIVDTITAASLSFRTAEVVTRFSNTPLAYMTNRADLDHFLVSKAHEDGCEVHDGEKVIRLERESDGMAAVCRKGKYQARVIVGADGANGIVRKSLELAGRYSWDVCIEDEVEVAGNDMDKWRGRVHLDLGSIPYGYGWVFPKSDHLSVGVAGRQRDGQAIHRYHQRFSAWLAKSSSKYALIRRSGHRLPMRSPGTPIVTRDALLIGDAAGLTEPLSGEGIYYAVRSAQIAAKVILDHLADAQQGLQRYERMIDNELMPNIQRAKAFVCIFNHASRLFFHFLARRERLWRATCRLLRGEIDYVEIGKTIGPFETFLNRLAW